MSSRYAPWYKRFLHKIMPFLFKECPAGNNHWYLDRYCFCDDVNGYPIWRFNKFDNGKSLIQVGNGHLGGIRKTCKKLDNGYWERGIYGDESI